MSRILRPKWDVVWMGLAQLLAQRSTCDRLQVGCVLVSWDHTRVAGVGYNGGPSGGFNDCLSSEPGKCGHLHAEINALIKADYTGGPYRAYVTTQPCFPCAVALINGGVKEVVYREPYRIVDGLLELKKAKVEVRQFRMVDVETFLPPPDKIDARTMDEKLEVSDATHHS